MPRRIRSHVIPEDDAGVAPSLSSPTRRLDRHGQSASLLVIAGVLAAGIGIVWLGLLATRPVLERAAAG